MPSLPPPRGEYRWKRSPVVSSGSCRKGSSWQVQRAARVDIKMAIGDTTRVGADSWLNAAGIETENATLSKVVDNRSIVNLPLNTRNAPVVWCS